MKSLTRLIITFTSIAFLGCADGDTPTKEEKLLNKLSHTWKLASAKLDDVEQEGYESFELTISGSAGSAVFAYGVIGRPQVSPWPSGGTWNFGEEMTAQIIRDPGSADELVIIYHVDGSQLSIEFQYTGEGFNTAKVASAEGHWFFTFSRE